jgi:hypothetical protein
MQITIVQPPRIMPKIFSKLISSFFSLTLTRLLPNRKNHSQHMNYYQWQNRDLNTILDLDYIRSPKKELLEIELKQVARLTSSYLFCVFLHEKLQFFF